MISVVILTYNESANIEACLNSVAWSDDVLVVDSGSQDDTCHIALRVGARVITRPFDNFANQRNFAIDSGNLRHDWVLHLDADETVTVELQAELKAIVRAVDAKPGYRVPSRLMLMGRWLRHSSMYPTYQVRFGRRDRLRFKMVGHGQRETLAPEDVGTVHGDLIHNNFSHGISAWLIKHARYARDEAETFVQSAKRYGWSDVIRTRDSVERRRVLKELSATLPLRPVARFAYVYFFRLGFLDGLAGFRYAILLAIYQYAIDANIAEIRARMGSANNT